MGTPVTYDSPVAKAVSTALAKARTFASGTPRMPDSAQCGGGGGVSTRILDKTMRDAVRKKER